MDRLTKKFNKTEQAIHSLDRALESYSQWENSISQEAVENLGIDYKEHLINLRDSTIQRFEYSIDLLWKYVKTYLDEKMGITPDVISPNTVIREAGKAGLITEDETETLLKMIKNRNLTSHIYHEEFAEILSGQLSHYYKTMDHIINRLTP